MSVQEQPADRVAFSQGGNRRGVIYDVNRMTVARGPAKLLERAARYASLGHGELELTEDDREMLAVVDEALSRLDPVEPLADDTTIARLILGNTYHCNMGCTYCYNELDIKDRKGSEVPEPMSLEIAKGSIDALIDQSGTRERLHLAFIGGEPLLEREILYESVEYAQRRGLETGKRFTIAVYTNGTMMNDDVIAWSNETDVSLVVSLDGPPTIHDSRRIYLSGRPTSRIVLRNIRKLVESSKQPMLRVRAVGAENVDVVSLHQYLLDLGFNEIHMQGMYNEQGIADGEQRDMARLLEWYRTQLIAGRVISVMPFEGFIEKLLLHGRAAASWYPCSAARNALGVAPTGDIYPCHHFLEESQFKLGHVTKGLPLLSERQQFFLRVDEREPCRSCWARHACGGECYHRAHTGGAGYTGVLPETCRTRKSVIGLTLELFAELASSHPSALRAIVQKQYTRVTPNWDAYAYKDLAHYAVA